MAGYVGNVPVPQSVREDQSFTATAGQTTFNTLGYTDGNRIKVTLNGVLLEGGGVDYTATNGSDVVLTVAAVIDDIVRFETFNEVQLVSNTSTTPIIKTNLTLKNDTHEDTDGGRESTVIFSGEQSGGEITTLAEIEASHDGTADDQKGDLIFRTNDGNDGTSPTERLRINSGGDMLFSSEDPSLTLANTTHEDSEGGRESTIAFQGEQSGGEISLLAQIEAAHDGTADDEKGDLIFRTNDGSDGTSPTERVRIDSDGNIGVNINAPSSMLHLFDGGTDTGITLQSKVQANATASITLMSRKADNSNVNAVLKNVDGKIQSSVGIMFGSDTADANALDDYEEGTFTPSYQTSNNDASSLTYGSSTLGSYIKIGRLIHFQLTVHLTSAAAGSGTPQIRGLPYTSSDSVPNNQATRFTVSTYGVNFQGGAGQLTHAYLPTVNVAYLQFLTTNDNGAWTVNSTSNFVVTNNTFVTIAGMYITN